MSLFPAFLATRFPLKDFSWLAHFDPIGYPVLLLRCNEKRFIFFFSPSFVQSSPSSQFSRRIIASSIRSYTRFHIKSLISLIFSKINKNIGDKKKEKKEEIFLENFIELNELFLITMDGKEKKRKEIGRYRKYKVFLESINIRRKERKENFLVQIQSIILSFVDEASRCKHTFFERARNTRAWRIK